jgi:hypothetical protein
MLQRVRENTDLPVIFKGFMNCLVEDSRQHGIHALRGGMTRSGFKFHVIDAGWYASQDE